jgi:sugar/nucleoside kinase (ribokinase family)
MDITLPALFLIDTKADEDEVQRFISITPPVGAMALTPDGLRLASAIAEIVRTDFQTSEDDAIPKYLTIAEQIGRPVALIGNFPQLMVAI